MSKKISPEKEERLDNIAEFINNMEAMEQIPLDVDITNIVHVLPVNDITSHSEMGLGCLCSPRIELQGNKGILVIHHAYDKREYLNYSKETE